MDMFGPFGFSDKKLPLLDRLTELCTLLAIGELDFIPIDAVCETLLEGFKNRKDSRVDGDVYVITARGLAHVLSHVTLFNFPISKKEVALLVKCIDSLFQVVLSYYTLDAKNRNTVICYTNCNHAELNEEVLKIIKEVAMCGSSPKLLLIAKAIPRSFDQVVFCEHLLDGTKWTACHVIRFLNFLVRVGDSGDGTRRDRFIAITLSQLRLLQDHFDVDYEWDELLRALTEMVIALATFDKPSANDISSLMECYLQLVCKICVDGAADTRQDLVFACADAVCATFSSKDSAPPVQEVAAETMHQVLTIVVRLLSKNEHLLLHFPNPFTQKVSSGNSGEEVAAEGDETVRVLSNLQWEVSSAQWSALALLGKLLGAIPEAKAQYEWAFRETDDMYYCYSTKDAATLSDAYFARAPVVELMDENDAHHVNLRLMMDTNSRSKIKSQMFFQPVPTQYLFVNKLLHVPSAAFAEKQVAACTIKTELRRVLRSISFGSTPIASLAKMVFLHLVCHDAPQNTEETKGALRNVVATQSPAVLEHLCAVLVKRDRTWAVILHEAGIGEALQGRWHHPQLDHLPQAVGQRKRGRSNEKGEAAAAHRPSPVAESINKAGSAPPTPAMLPQTTSDVELFLKTASFAELFRLLEDLDTVDRVTCEKIVQTVCSLAEGSEAHHSWCNALAAYLLRELQKLSIQGSALHLLDTVQAENSFGGVFICHKRDGIESETKDGAGVPAGVPQLFCRNKHLLKVHFSTNWKCDLCGGSSEYGSLACRDCNYDVCSHCTERALGCVKANVTATVGDVLASWRESNDTNTRKRKKKKTVSSGLDLFTQTTLFSHTTPVSVLLRGADALHCATIGSSCKCNVTRPHTFSSWAQEPKKTPIFRLLHHFAPFLCKDNAVWRGLIEAVTSYGVLVFTHGVRGLPEPLYSAIVCLQRSLPLAFKCELTRFLTVECRRYALKYIADAGVTLRGSAQGEVHTNGLAGKIVVQREDKKDTLLRLAAAFHPSVSLRAKVTFAFEGEEGTGNGPTQELYAEMSAFFAENAEMWYVADDSRTLGLPSRTANKEQEFFVCGALTGRAFVDGYAMDVHYHPLLWCLLRSSGDRDRAPVSKEELLSSSLWTLLSELEPTLANSFKQMLVASASELEMMYVEDENGNSITTVNVLSFVAQKVKSHFTTTLTNLQAFALGLLRSIDVSTLFSLSDEELSLVLGGQENEDEDAQLFTEAQLESVVTEAHGYTAGAKEVKMLISIVGSDFCRKEQQLFLEFLTGSSRLPLNGLQGLGRKITVVKKEMDSKNEATLPSCSTCFLYLKLPPYTSRDVMKKRLLLAITEGRKNFSLS